MADTKRIGGIHYEIMRSCYNPNCMLYKQRGALGIKVCEEWHDRAVFRKWCMDNGFKTGMQVFRKDQTKDFTPDNCYVSEPITRRKKGDDETPKQRAKRHRQIKDKLKVHNLCDCPMDATYRSMHFRCENPNCDCYDEYGGRGISVCEEWSGREGHYNFLQWAYANNWKPGLSLDRIDNNKGYSPNNCRWATIEEQIRNRRVTKFYSYNGVESTICEIARAENINTEMLRYRLKEKGMSLEDAIISTKESMKKKNKL